jgi:hypothetical protein
MAPTRVREPFHRDGWVYEEKVDGGRSLAYKDHARVRLISRNGRDHTRRFPEIAGAVAKLSARYLVLDGEIAIYDQQLRSSLMRSIERVGLLNPIIVTERGRLVIGWRRLEAYRLLRKSAARVEDALTLRRRPNPRQEDRADQERCGRAGRSSPH